LCVLYPKLLEGYLLDGLEYLGAEPTAAEILESFLERAEAAPRSRRRSAGLGDDLRLRGDDVIGSALEIEDELVQLCVFSARQRSINRDSHYVGAYVHATAPDGVKFSIWVFA
jgi:hypothetical protein